MTREMGAALRRIQLGSALSAFGLGFTVPYLYVYVAQVRDLGAGTAGVVLAVFAMAALAVLPFTGRAIDRRGPLPVLVVASALASVGAAALGFASSVPAAVLAAAVLGAGTAVMQPALATMLVWCSSTATRTRAFAMQFFLQNLGLGLGGLVGGQLVDVNRPASFTMLFLIEAAMFVVLGVVVTTVRMPRTASLGGARPSGDAAAKGGGLRALLSHRAMVQLCVLGFVLFFACYGQFESGLAAYGTEAAGIEPSTLGFALAANTAVIVVAQFVVLRLVERRRRSRVIAAVGLIWAFAWIVAGYAGWATAARPWRRPRSSRRTRCSGWVRRCCRRPSPRWSPIWRRSRWSGSTTRRSPCASSSRWRSVRPSAVRWGRRCTARTS